MASDLANLGIEKQLQPDGWIVTMEQHARWQWHVSVSLPQPGMMPLTWTPNVSACTRRGAVRLAKRTLMCARRFQAMEAMRSETRHLHTL